MADIGRIYDSMGRLIGETENVRDILRSMLQRDVGKAQAYNPKSESSSNAQKELEKQVEKLSKIIQETNDNAKDYAEKIIEASKVIEEASKNKPKSESAFVDPSKIYDAIASGMEKGLSNEKSQVAVAQESAAKSANPDGRGFSRMERGIGELVKHATKKGSLYVSDAEVQKLLEDIKDSLASGGGGGGIGGGGGFGPDDPDFNRKLELEWGDTLDFDPVTIAAEQNAAEVSQIYRNAIAGSIMNSISGMLDQLNPIQDAFGNAIFGEMSYQQEMKKVAFQTQGITQEAGNMQAAFFQTGKVVAKTGYDLSVFQKNYTQAIKKGLKPQKESLNITTSALNTAKMIGGNADGLADTFVDWNQQLGLSDNQLADVGRGIRDVAKFSGITGENLEQAVKSSEQFMKNMKSAGTLTATASKNIMTMSAFAQKLGVADEMQGLMNGLTSSSNLLLNASQETKNMLYLAAGSVGRINDLQQGTLMNTKAGIKDLAQGMENTFKQITGYSSDQIDQMTAEEKMRINVQLESALGVGLEDFRRQIEVVGEAGKSYTERLATIDKQLEANLTLEERRALELQKQNMALSAGLEMSTKLADAAKGVDNVSEAVDKIRKNAGAGFGDIQNELVEMTKEMGMGDLASQVSSGDNEAIAKAMALSATTKLADAGGTDFSSEMLAAIKANDMSEIRELQEKMTAEQQKMGIDQEANTDPISNMDKTMKEINETIRGFTGPALHTLMGILGAIGVLPLMIGGAIVSAFLGAGGIVASIVGGLAGIIGPLSALVGTAGGAASGVASGVASGASAIGGKMMAMPGNIAQGGAAFGTSMFGMAKGMLQAAPGIMAAAGAIAVLSLGLVAIGAAFLKLSSGVLGMTGMSSGEMLETGLVVAGMVAGIAGLAKIITASQPVFMAASKLQGSIPTILMGALVITAIAIPIVALATAIVGISKLLMGAFGLDVKTVAQTALQVGAVMMGAGLIFNMAALAIPSLLIMGLVAPALYGLAPTMLLGALAITAVSLGVVALATAIVGMTKAIMSATGMDVKTVAQTALQVGALFTGAALIATMAGAAALALAGLGASWAAIAVAAPWMLVGAGVLTLITAGTVAFAAALVKISQAIIAYTGVTPKVVAQTAMQVASLFGGAALIAGMAGAAAYGLAALGGQFALIYAAAPFMLLGALALSAITLGTVAFAAALVRLTNLIMSVTGVTPDMVAQTAEGVAMLFKAAGQIGWSALKFSAGLFVLGAASKLLIAAAPFMLKGAVALAAISLGTIAFASALVRLSSGIMSVAGITPDMVAQTAEGVATLFKAAGDIGWSALKFSGGLFALGLAAPFLFLASPIMLLGADALFEITAGTVAFASSLMLISSAIMSATGVTAESAAQTAEGIATLFKAAGDIGRGALKFSGGLFALGLAAPFLFLASPIMLLGAAALTAITAGTVAFAASLISMTQDLGALEEVEDASKKVIALTKMLEVVPDMMNSVIDGIVPLTEGGLFSDAPIDKLKGKVLAEFSSFFWAVSSFLRYGIMMPVNVYFPKAGEVQSVAKVVNALGEMVGVIPAMIDNVINNLIPIVQGSWWSDTPADKLTNEVKNNFSEFFWALSDFLRYGVMMPINVYFPKAGEVNQTLSKMNSMGLLVATIPGFLERLSMSITGLVESKGWFGLGASPMQEIAAKVVTFSSYFQAIGFALGEGVVRPIRDYFPKPKQLKTALKQLNSMASLVDAIPSFLMRINSSIGSLVDGFWWSVWGENPMSYLTKKVQLFSGYFQAIATALGEGIIDPIKNYWPKPKEIKAVGKQIDQMEKVIKKLPDFLESLDESVGDFFLGTWWKMSSLYNRTSVFADYFKSIAVSINDGLIQPIHKEWPKSKDIKEVSKRIDEVQKIVETLPSFLESLTTVVEEYVDGGWWKNDKIDGLSSKVEVFAAYFENIAAALDDGLLKPIQKWPESSKIEEIGEKISTVESVISELPGTLQLLTDSMQSLESGAWWDLQLGKEKQKYIDFFSSTGSFIVDSLINPVNLLPETSAIQESITRIELICEIFNKYAEAMSCMAEASKNLSSTEPIDLAGIENVGDTIKKAQPAIEKMSEGAQVKETTLFPEDYRDPASLSQEELMMQKTGAQVQKTTIPGTDESNEDLLKRLTTVDPSKDPTLVSDKLHRGLESGIEKVGSGLPAGMTEEELIWGEGNAGTGRKFERSSALNKRLNMDLEQDKAMRAANGAGNLPTGDIIELPKGKWTPTEDFIRGGGKDQFLKEEDVLRELVKQGYKPDSKIFQETLLKFRQGKLDRAALMGIPVSQTEIGAAAKGGDFLTTGAQLLLVGEKGAERISVKPADQVANLEKKAFEYSEMASEEAASVLNVPSAVRMEPTQAQPKPLSDVHERVRQQYATEDEGGKNQSKDMADIANASNSQVGLLEKLHEDNQKLIALLTPSGDRVGETDPMGSPSTRANKKPISSPQYGSWQYGKMGQNASKQLLTPGE